MFSIFTNELKECLMNAKKEMNLLRHSYIGSEHFILALLKSDNSLSKIFNNYNITYDRFKKSVIDLIGYGNDNEKLFIYTPLFKKIMEDAISISKNSNTNVTLENVLLTMLDEAEGVAYRIFCGYDIDLDSFYDEIDNSNYQISKRSKYVEEVGIDLCKKAFDNELDPVIGRDKEVERIIEIMCRKSKRNPLLIGEAGVGKTSIVEELARRIVNSNVPRLLQNKKVISLSMATLVSGTKYRGEFEEKVIKIFNEIEKNNDVIVFIDEMHTLIGAGGADGAIDASNILKPALARGKVIVIGATTTREYNKFIEEDKALSRRFQTVMVEEPKEKELINILEKSKPNYENYHNVSISKEIIEYIIKLSKIYLPYRKEPDKSIDVLDESCSKASIQKDHCSKLKERLVNELKKINEDKSKYLKNSDYKSLMELRNKERKILSKINNLDFKLMSKKIKKVVTKEIVNEVIKNKSNIPVYNNKDIKSVLQKLKRELIARFNGLSKEIDGVIDASKQIIKITNKKKPYTILFGGVKNNSKYELAKTFGKYFYNNKIIEIDLSVYMSSSKLLYEKSTLNSIKEYPFSLIIIMNYDNSILEVKEIINKIIKDSKLEMDSGEELFFNNSTILFIEDKNKSSLGFDTTLIDNNNNIDKIINFEVMVTQ